MMRWREKFNLDPNSVSLTQHSSIGLSLPQNVYLMTFEPWKDDSILIRFEHLLEKDEDAELSKPVRFNLADVYPNNEIELREVSLSGNQWIEDFGRLQFKSETSTDYFLLNNSSSSDGNSKRSTIDIDDLEITLNPMEIRSFIMTLSPKV